MHVYDIAGHWDRMAEKTEHDFRFRHLPDTVMWPGMRQLPYPVQLLVTLELHVANKMC